MQPQCFTCLFHSLTRQILRSLASRLFSVEQIEGIAIILFPMEVEPITQIS